MHISIMLVSWSLFSVLRNSIVLADNTLYKM